MSQNARWLSFLPETASIEGAFRRINIPADCEFLVAQLRGRVVQVSEVYRVHDTFPLEIHDVGNWSLTDGLRWEDRHIWQRRGNLRGVPLAASFVRVRQASHFCHITQRCSNCVPVGPASNSQGLLNHISFVMNPVYIILFMLI
jgi:hypothetical protein